MNATLEERKELWKFMHAMASFEQVVDICEYCRKEKLDLSHKLYHRLMVSLIVTYAKPFKQKKAFRLSEKLVSKEHEDTHRFLIIARDKFFAHSDPGSHDLPINTVLLKIESGRVMASTTSILPKNISQVKALAQILLEKTDYHATKIWRKFGERLAVFDGEYEVNCEASSDSLLIPVRKVPFFDSKSAVENDTHKEGSRSK